MQNVIELEECSIMVVNKTGAERKDGLWRMVLIGCIKYPL
jgi:hypothetical protein